MSSQFKSYLIFYEVLPIYNIPVMLFCVYIHQSCLCLTYHVFLDRYLMCRVCLVCHVLPDIYLVCQVYHWPAKFSWIYILYEQFISGLSCLFGNISDVLCLCVFYRILLGLCLTCPVYVYSVMSFQIHVKFASLIFDLSCSLRFESNVSFTYLTCHVF